MGRSDLQNSNNAQRLLHELEVHKIELETQNEELRAARLELEVGLRRYTELFDFAPIGYATLTADATICELNHTGARLLGKERARLVGTRFFQYLSAKDAAALLAVLQAALSHDAKETCEVEVEREPPVQLMLTATPWHRAEPGVLLAFEDITDRRLKESQLAASEGALRNADRRKDEFLAVLSHELRNPLAPIRNSMSMLTRGGLGPEQSRKLCTIVDRQISHLTRLIDDLLDVTRIRRGKIQLQKESVELGELVRRTLDDLRSSFDVLGIGLEGSVESAPLWVSADPARLVQVLSNLLGNAEKFTPRGGHVRVSLYRQDESVVLRVSDTGVGIAPEMLGLLFEPFAQAPQSMDRARGGLGLGLSMVKGLVELHGGTVRIDSDGADRGVEVTITLPLVDAPAARQPSLVPASVRRRRVMVIEDNIDAADTLGEALEFFGHDAAVAYDGPTGIEQARAFNPDVLLCDLGLPGMDGYAVARAFRGDARLKHTFLVALSGYARPEDRQRAVEAGFDRHVAKPPNLDQLSRFLAEAPEAGVESSDAAQS